MLKEAKKVPAIRFSGFTDSWEQRKLNEVLDLLKDGTHGTHQDADEGPLLLSAKNIKNGEIVWDDSDRRISIEEYKSIHSNFQLQPDDILLTIVGSIGETAILRNPQGLTFQRSVAFLRPDKHINSEFMCSEIQSTRFQNELRKRKSTSAQPGIYLGDLQEIPFIFPANPDEQRNISSCFCNLDNLIALHQRKLNQQKKLKKYFLQNMFPAKGEKVPRIRFKGFTGDWEQHNLGELATFNKGAGYSKSDLKASGTQIILYGRLYTKYETVIKQVDTFVDSRPGSIYSEGGEVIVPASGETAEDIAIASVVEKPGILLGGDLNIIHPIRNLDSTFLAISISNGEPHKEMAKRAQGKSVVHLHNDDLSQIKFRYPSIEEQSKISKFFSILDNLITLHQRKLNQLLTMKKFMLQNLFI